MEYKSYVIFGKLKKKMKKNKSIRAWIFYDWANSVYPLTISTAIFPIYYTSLFINTNSVSFFGYDIKNTAVISFITVLAFLLIILKAPILSAISDSIGNKKIFMKACVFIGSLSCVGLYWFNIESIYFGLFLYFLALVCFQFSLIFYDSYLPIIAKEEQQDSISAKGYALGYIGSVLLLLFSLFLILNPSLFGIGGSEEEASLQAMRISFVLAGVWWFGFSQYSFYHLPKGDDKVADNKIQKLIKESLADISTVIKQLTNLKILKRFLSGYFLYSISLQTFLLMAIYFGEAEIQWSSTSEKRMGLLIAIILVQVIAAFGAILTSKISKRIGNIYTLILISVLWGLLFVIAYFIKTPIEFYCVAFFLGFFMGGIQSLSRSTFSKLLPNKEKTASFFGFFSIIEKVAIIIGMALFGILDQVTGNMRSGAIMFATLFLFAAIILFKLPKKLK